MNTSGRFCVLSLNHYASWCRSVDRHDPPHSKAFTGDLKTGGRFSCTLSGLWRWYKPPWMNGQKPVNAGHLCWWCYARLVLIDPNYSQKNSPPTRLEEQAGLQKVGGSTLDSEILIMWPLSRNEDFSCPSLGSSSELQPDISFCLLPVFISDKLCWVARRSPASVDWLFVSPAGSLSSNFLRQRSPSPA